MAQDVAGEKTFENRMPELNNEAEQPSYMEYTIFHKTTYEEAFEKYHASFFHGLREGKKFPHKVKIVQKPGAELIREICSIYTKQMERHNSFVFPLTFFCEFLACPSSFLFLIEFKQKIIAYFCCFQNQDNIYASIGGGHPDYFAQKSSNKLYDELIRYACQKNLNIHLGIGEHGSGYQKFKQNAGMICYKTERFPGNDNIFKWSTCFLKFRITGILLKYFSRSFPHLTAYLVMPFS